MREPPHPKTQDIQLSRVLYALSDPVRLMMIVQLAGGAEFTCSDLSGDRAKSSMSHHFRTLRDAGLMRTRVVGSVHMNRLRSEDLEALFPGMITAIVAASSVKTSSRKPARAAPSPKK